MLVVSSNPQTTDKVIYRVAPNGTYLLLGVMEDKTKIYVAETSGLTLGSLQKCLCMS